MPNTCHNRHDTQQVPQENSNTKDPPCSRRREDFYKALDEIAADLRASQQELQAHYELKDQYAKHFLSCSRDKEYYALLDECQRMHLILQWTRPNVTYPFLSVLTSTLVRRAELTCVKELAQGDEPKLPCSSPHLSPCADAHSFESIRLKATRSVPTTQEGLGIDPSSMDDEENSLDCSTPLVGDGNDYRDTLSCQNTACADSQTLRTSSSAARAVLQWSDEDFPGSAMHILPDVVESDTLAHERCSPLECNLTVRIRPDTACPNEERQPLMGTEMSGTRPHPDVELSRRTMDASPPVQREVSPSITKQPSSREAVSENEETSTTCEYSPIAKAALVLPNQSLAFSMRAAPSRLRKNKTRSLSREVPKRMPAMPIWAAPSHSSNDELKISSPAIRQRHDVEGAISPRMETNTDAC
jgi:hypothetical protein